MARWIVRAWLLQLFGQFRRRSAVRVGRGPRVQSLEVRVVLESEPVRSHHEFRLPGLVDRRVRTPGALACRSWASSWCGWRAVMALQSCSSIPRPYRERAGWEGKQRELMRGESSVRAGGFAGFPRSAGGRFRAHNPKVVCKFAGRAVDVLLTSVEPLSVSTSCRAPSPFLTGDSHPLWSWSVPDGSSAAEDGSNPAPATKRILGTPTYPEGSLAPRVCRCDPPSRVHLA